MQIIQDILKSSSDDSIISKLDSDLSLINALTSHTNIDDLAEDDLVDDIIIELKKRYIYIRK